MSSAITAVFQGELDDYQAGAHVSLLQTKFAARSLVDQSNLTSQDLTSKPMLPKYLSIPEGHPLLNRLRTRLNRKEFKANIRKDSKKIFHVPLTLLDPNIFASMPSGGRSESPKSALPQPKE